MKKIIFIFLLLIIHYSCFSQDCESRFIDKALRRYAYQQKRHKIKCIDYYDKLDLKRIKLIPILNVYWTKEYRKIWNKEYDHSSGLMSIDSIWCYLNPHNISEQSCSSFEMLLIGDNVLKYVDIIPGYKDQTHTISYFAIERAPTPIIMTLAELHRREGIKMLFTIDCIAYCYFAIVEDKILAFPFDFNGDVIDETPLFGQKLIEYIRQDMKCHSDYYMLSTKKPRPSLSY